MKVLAVFGSTSDRKVYRQLTEELELRHIDYELRIASAHKSPELVRELAASDYDFFIAGAGLSAALPGVIAAETIRPVAGIPCKGAFSGLDALLSVWQMPKGVAVMGTPVENATEAAKAAEFYSEKPERITVVRRSEAKAELLASKAEAFLSENGIAFDKIESDVPSYSREKTVYIDFINLDEAGLMKDSSVPVLSVPYTAREGDAKEALKMLNIRKGIWFGLGNTENACLAAVQLLNSGNRYTGFLNDYRKRIAEKIVNTEP
jgi:5-(carboxyamino)imidazole ribonucleotide mutase